MKLSKSKLKQLIREELENVLYEKKGDEWHMPRDWVGKTRRDKRDMQRHELHDKTWYAVVLRDGGCSGWVTSTPDVMSAEASGIDLHYGGACGETYGMISLTGEDRQTGDTIFQITAVSPSSRQ
jgi:hypothetical protein